MANPEPTVAAADVPSVKTTNTTTTTAQRPVCALYMRVSTKGHGQTTDTQAGPLRQYAERRGFDVIEYKDEGHSGSKDRRPALDRLMRETRERGSSISSRSSSSTALGEVHSTWCVPWKSSGH